MSASEIIDGKIRIINNKIELIIPQDKFEKFKKYSNIDKNGNVIDQEFYAGFNLNDQQLYIIGSFNQQAGVDNGDMHPLISSVGIQGNGQSATDLQEMKDKLGLNDKSEVEVNISKHFAKELKDAINTLKEEKENIEKKLQAKTQELLAMQAQHSTDVESLQADLKAKDKIIAQLQQQPSNTEIEKLKKDLGAKNTEIQQLEKDKTDLKNQLAEAEKKNKALEAKKQPTEQSKAPVYTATVGVGLAAGLLLAAVLGHTTKLPMLAIVGVAAASVLVAGGITYYALKPSTKMNETQEPKQTTANGYSKTGEKNGPQYSSRL